MEGFRGIAFNVPVEKISLPEFIAKVITFQQSFKESL